VISRRAITVLIGESGAGKTTVLRVLAGLEQPTTGSCLYAASETVGMVFQQLNLFPHLTILEQIAQPLYVVHGIDRVTAYQRARHCLALVGLAAYEDRYPHELSGGQQQRVAIARALAGKLTLLLLDEPTSGLDPVTRDMLIRLLQRLRDEEDLTIVMSTHDMGNVEKIAEYICEMKQGTIVRSYKK
jgi:ABC-type polar amino acid transport system ATPase subunit